MPLAYVQHLDVQAGVIPPLPQLDGQRQGQASQDGRQGVLPSGCFPAQPGRQEQDIGIGQPVFQIWIRKIRRVVWNFRQQSRHKQNIPGQQGRYHRQQLCRRQAEKAQQDRHQPQHKHTAGGPQAQQIAQGRDQRQRAEVPAGQGHREHQSTHGSGKASRQEAGHPVPFPAVHQQAVQPWRQEQDARHGGKGQLQADGRGGKGICQQNQEQGRKQGRGAVAVPAANRRSQQKGQHDAGAQDGGAPPGEGRVERQQRQSAQCRETTAVFSCQIGHQRQQEAAVHPGNRQNVVQSRLRQRRGALIGKPGLVSCQDGGQEPGFIAHEQLRNA